MKHCRICNKPLGNVSKHCTVCGECGERRYLPVGPAAWFNENGFLQIDFSRWAEARKEMKRLLEGEQA